MKIDIYSIYMKRRVINIIYPTITKILNLWSESQGWTARATECYEREIDYSTDADVIAFSVYTQTAKSTYRIAEKFRKMGKVVVLGGIHFRGQTYKEALDKCDVVATSISEEQWINILDRIASGEIAPGSEKAVLIEDKENKFRLPNDLYKTFSLKRWNQAASSWLSYGCPHNCDFCSPFMGGKYGTRDIDVIYKEMENVKGETVFILDATFGLDKKHTIETMEAVAPLRKKIILETSLRRMQDREILEAMARGGVVAASIGVESFATTLNKNGGGDIRKNLEKIVNNAHDVGIAVEGNIIVGLDNDTEKIFDEIFDFYKKSNIDLILPGFLIPYPSSNLSSDMLERIFDTDWDHYNTLHVLYKPKRMSVEQLVNGFIRLLNNCWSMEINFKKIAAYYRRRGFSKETGMATLFRYIKMLEGRQNKKIIGKNYQAAMPRLKEQEANSPIG
jgi:bacteriochlorophyll C12 methyltransferase